MGVKQGGLLLNKARCNALRRQLSVLQDLGMRCGSGWGIWTASHCDLYCAMPVGGSIRAVARLPSNNVLTAKRGGYHGGQRHFSFARITFTRIWR